MSIQAIFGFNEICDLSIETQTKIFNKPDTSAELINDVAGSVLKLLSHESDRTALESFLKSVSYLDEKYDAQLSKRPFKNTIVKLQQALSSIRPASPEQQKSIFNLKQQFKAKLKNLDLNSYTLGAEIRELVTILGQLEKLGALASDQKSTLEKGLIFLRSKTDFRESFFESRAYNVLSSKSETFKTGLEKSGTSLSKTNLEGQRLLLKFLKQSDVSLNELAAAIPHQLKEIEKALIRTRLQIIIANMPASSNPFGEKFINNFFLFIEALKNFELEIAYPICEEGWKKALSTLDPKQTSQLGKLLKEYAYLDPSLYNAEIVLMAEEHYVKPLSIDTICTLDSDAFSKKLKQLDEGASDKMAKYYVTMYKKDLLEMHCWLAENLYAIKKPYDQSAHDHINMGNGTCLQNSLERHALLLKNPCKDPSLIPMGSSAKGRTQQATVNRSFEETRKGRLPIGDASKIQLQSLEKFGLKGSGTLAMLTPANLPKTVLSTLGGFSKTGFRGILIIGSPSGAHALNIQLNPQLQIFRFIDDNLGICEWGSFKEFQVQFSIYLETFYPEYTKFALEQYVKLK